MPGELLTSREGSTLILTLSDAATRNALSTQVHAAGVEALDIAESDDSVRVVVLRGAGEHFSSGTPNHCLEEWRHVGASAPADAAAQLNQWIESLRAFPKPVVAAVEGVAIGAGMALVLACDLVVAASDSHFAMSQGKLGLTPEGGGSWHLARLLPRSLALELLWLGDALTATRLHSLGLVTRVTDKGQALTVALSLADALGAMAPNAVASAKELVARAALAPLSEHLEAERRHFVTSLLHENGTEGLQALAEQRSPAFR